MNDRAVELLEQYNIEVLHIKKGRGAFLCDTGAQSLIFKEFSGPESRLQLQERILKQIETIGTVRTEQIIPTAEGQLYVKDADGTMYVLKTWTEGRECNIRDKEECIQAVALLARLHNCMVFKEDLQDVQMALPPEKEYDKHNRELRRVRKYLSQKSQKTWFEIHLAKHFDFFYQQAMTVTQEWMHYREIACKQPFQEFAEKEICICHGDYQYHNILKDRAGWILVNFEKYVADDSVRDLYLLLRKLLEKSDWSVELGSALLAAYEKIHPLSAISRIDLYYRLSYPEKFWKIANFYFNSGKAWIPGRNLEKLEKLVEQETSKQLFLDTVFRNVNEYIM